MGLAASKSRLKRLEAGQQCPACRERARQVIKVYDGEGPPAAPPAETCPRCGRTVEPLVTVITVRVVGRDGEEVPRGVKREG